MPLNKYHQEVSNEQFRMDFLITKTTTTMKLGVTLLHINP